MGFDPSNGKLVCLAALMNEIDLSVDDYIYIYLYIKVRGH